MVVINNLLGIPLQIGIESTTAIPQIAGTTKLIWNEYLQLTKDLRVWPLNAYHDGSYSLTQLTTTALYEVFRL